MSWAWRRIIIITSGQCAVSLGKIVSSAIAFRSTDNKNIGPERMHTCGIIRPTLKNAHSYMTIPIT